MRLGLDDGARQRDGAQVLMLRRSRLDREHERGLTVGQLLIAVAVLLVLGAAALVLKPKPADRGPGAPAGAQSALPHGGAA